MVKIVGICGSPRKDSGSEYVLQKALSRLKENYRIETELITLSDKKITRCNGCGACYSGKLDSYCIHNDDVKPIIEKLLEADGCIIASPVYLTTIPGILKDLFDRICIALYTPGNECFFQKEFRVGAAIAVGGVRNGGQETTLTTLHNFLMSFGYLLTSGPCFELGSCETHIGVSIWSKDGSKTSIDNDQFGLKCLEYMSDNVGKTVMKLQ